jgi:2-keto-4-pentenoate hydratase/2-oxohepta-3-ene-1,7-dioic acid hydratase in catechol pathway
MAKWGRFLQKNSEQIVYGKLSEDCQSIQIAQGDIFSDTTCQGEWVAIDQFQILTPCVPSKLIGLWNNFHALAQQQGNAIPVEPLYFIKGSNSYLAHGQAIEIPQQAHESIGRVVYEGELGIVIGKQAKAISPEQAHTHIFGYTCINDVTALEILGKDESFKQWTRAKSYDTFGPFGPWIDTTVEYQNLHIQTLLNGRVRQNYPARDMIFNPAQIVSHLSFDMTLYPGDVIACGTSVGILPIKAGQTVEVLIEGIGTLTNTIEEKLS